MNLEAGEIIYRFKRNTLPFAQVVVGFVEELTENNQEEFTFTDGNCNAMENEEENYNYESNEEYNSENESQEEDENEYEILDSVKKLIVTKLIAQNKQLKIKNS